MALESLATDNIDVAIVFTALELTRMRSGTYNTAKQMTDAFAENYQAVRKAYTAEDK
jgi:hypothetical protein